MPTPTDRTSLSAGPEGLLDWSERGRILLESLAEVAAEPLEERTMRAFRRDEAMELSGMSAARWNAYRASRSEAGYRRESRMSLAELHAVQDEIGTRPSRPSGISQCRLAVANYKGGAAKTTLSLHLSQYLALRGWRVLLIDCDPQGTVSRQFSQLPDIVDPDCTMGRIFDNFDEPDATAYAPEPMATHIDGLDLIPASLEMTGADIAVAAAFMRGDPETRSLFYSLINRALAPLDDRYDIILLDTAPAFSFLALNVLWASSGIITPIPTAISDFSATIDFCGMSGQMLERLNAITGAGKTWDPTLFIHTRVDDSATAEMVRQMSVELWGANVLPASVPESRAFGAALTRLRSVYEVTSSEVDHRQLRRAREAVDAVGAGVVRALRGAWSTALQEEQTNE